MKTRPTLTSILSGQSQRHAVGLCMAACLAIVTVSTSAKAAPPTPADDIDYAASGFRLPPGVNPTAWSTASGVSAAGGMNYASQPAIYNPMMSPPAGSPMAMNGMPGGPMMARSPLLSQHPSMMQQPMMQAPSGPRPPGALPMGGPSMGGPMGSPASMMAMGMPGMGPNGPMMGRPGMEGPLMGPSQMAGAGMPGASSIPASFPSGPVQGMPYMGMPGAGYAPAGYSNVMPVGFNHQSSCDGGCDGACGGYAPQGYGGYETCGCDGGGCDGGCGSASGGGFRGLLPSLTGQCRQCRGAGCSSCASRALQNDCIGYGGVFGDLVNGRCMDSDLGLFMGTLGGSLAGLAECLSPYGEAGKCAQRWYDISAEYMGLSSNLSQGNQVFATRGVGGDPALSLNDVEGGSLASGVRLSAAVILGVGGNLEVTYMGGHEWSDRATANADVINVAGEGNLFSYISDFGNQPLNIGYDDTDRSLSQSVASQSFFHSGELNYRRRTVGPGCKFQGSWLAGMRYLRFDNNLLYSAVGSFNDGAGIVGTLGGDLGTELRFYNSAVRTKNDYFGGQLGYDFWWNVTPGVQFGVGMKGAWMQNDWQRNYQLSANSAGPGATVGSESQSDRDRKGTIMGELEATLLYRFSHEWTFRSSYHLMGIDDVVGTTIGRDNIVGVVDGLPGTTALPAPVQFNSAVLQGFTVGLEYLW